MTGVFEVLDAGLFTTIQDLGRPSHRSSGVPVGGAMDRFALVAANLLVRNLDGAAALECTLKGPRLRARQDAAAAVTGGDFELELNGEAVPSWTTLKLRAGDVLSIGRRLSGARCYLAVAGGFAGQRWLGSLSTYVLVQKGGLEGRALRAGDVLTRVEDPAQPAAGIDRHLAEHLRPRYGSALPAVPGPHESRVPRSARKLLFSETFTVASQSDRMGYRLAGPELETKPGELLSFGVAPGSLQLPPGGPILLMADHQTAGGYPVAACVARSGLPLAAQLGPGDECRFDEVDVSTAQAEWRRLHARLESLRIGV